jgi:hypothetical protein
VAATKRWTAHLLQAINSSIDLGPSCIGRGGEVNASENRAQTCTCQTKQFLIEGEGKGGEGGGRGLLFEGLEPSDAASVKGGLRSTCCDGDGGGDNWG